jgi:hypothetical protein
VLYRSWDDKIYAPIRGSIIYTSASPYVHDATTLCQNRLDPGAYPTSLINKTESAEVLRIVRKDGTWVATPKAFIGATKVTPASDPWMWPNSQELVYSAFPERWNYTTEKCSVVNATSGRWQEEACTNTLTAVVCDVPWNGAFTRDSIFVDVDVGLARYPIRWTEANADNKLPKPSLWPTPRYHVLNNWFDWMANINRKTNGLRHEWVYGFTVQLKIDQCTPNRDVIRFTNATSDHPAGVTVTSWDSICAGMGVGQAKFVEYIKFIHGAVHFVTDNYKRNSLTFSWIIWDRPVPAAVGAQKYLMDAESLHVFAFLDTGYDMTWDEAEDTCRNMGPGWRLAELSNNRTKVYME